MSIVSEIQFLENPMKIIKKHAFLILTMRLQKKIIAFKPAITIVSLVLYLQKYLVNFGFRIVLVEVLNVFHI